MKRREQYDTLLIEKDCISITEGWAILEASLGSSPQLINSASLENLLINAHNECLSFGCHQTDLAFVRADSL